MARIISALVLLLGGAALGMGGVRLAGLGGTPLYVVLALGLLTSGGLLLIRRAEGLWVFGLTLLFVLVWALFEVGFDWWQLAPRGGLLVVFGLWLTLPWPRRGLRGGPMRAGRMDRAAGGPLLIAPIALSIVAAVAAILVGGPHRVDGVLPNAAVAAETGIAGAPPVADADWPAYGRTQAGNRYSPLGQIDTGNVDRLEVAWVFHTGDLPGGGATYEVTPIKVGERLFLCTPSQIVIALDAATGSEVWRYDPEVSADILAINSNCRGVTYYEVPGSDPEAPCARRIFMPVTDARMIALDAADGSLCAGFGEGGTIDLGRNMPNRGSNLYYSNSPPVVALGVLVVGGSIADNVSTNEPSGVIRGFDAETGALLWNFDTGNPTETAPIAAGATYTANSPNSWAPMSADETLGLVFAPIGNAPPDQYGADRSAATERFSASVVALDILTGTLVWVTQFVHHDLWDMDTPAQPTLVDLDINGEIVPSLVQATKQGDVYVLDRRTGEPVLPVTETAAPTGAVAGDFTAPTQPVSALTFMPDRVEERDMWGITMFDQLMCRIQFRSLRYEGRYTPPSLEGTLQNPGNFGVFNWGGIAVDPVRQIMFGTPSYLAFTVQLLPRPDDTTPILSGGPPHNNENFGAPYAVDIQTFLSPIGLPCQAPPWGYVAGADLRTGKIAWQHRNGTVRDLAPLPLPFELGVPDLGGPILTAGGLAFMSGSLDYFVRAFDVTTGEELWRDRLPAGGQATPMTYATSDGRQFVVVMAGGHSGLGTRLGDSIIAYALPAE